MFLYIFVIYQGDVHYKIYRRLQNEWMPSIDKLEISYRIE